MIKNDIRDSLVEENLKSELLAVNNALQQTSYWKATELIQLELKKITLLNNLKTVKTSKAD